uniref:mannan endo-1,4-beta-mannosidase n=1 Tax=Tetradesmus obliquus TaxID=3088 RepID=A0A383V8Z8_TETOB|eukprot:jgi/Sobl393_1/8985/SZX60806.1
MLLMLLLHNSAAAAADLSAGDSTAGAALQRQLLQSVPGQAFHDWRSELLDRNFTHGTISAAAAAALAANKATTTSSSSSTTDSNRGDASIFDSTSSSSSSSSNEQKGPEPVQPQQHKWINLVGYRDQLQSLPGPPKLNTTHPAALQRWQAAKAVLAEAAAKQAVAAAAQAAAAAAAVAAASAAASAAAVLSGPPLGGVAQLPGAPVHSISLADASETAAAAANIASSSSSSNSKQRPGNASASLDQVEVNLLSYVRRSPGSGLRLHLNGKPWLMMGFDVPHALQLAVQEEKRYQLLELMDTARGLGFNTMKVWAFADGGMPGVGSAVRPAWKQEAGAKAKQQQQQQQQGGAGQQEAGAAGEQQQQQQGEWRLAMQPAPGILNATVMSAGLDWLVHVAGLRGMKLLLVLTHGSSDAWGGMKAFTDWVDPALTVTDFYGNDTVKSVFLDYTAGIIGHTSSLSGVPLREDPVVAGWQLAEAPQHPGHPYSEPLLGWLKQMGTFLREKAPHQLVLSGLEGFFGAASPHHLKHNPYAQLFDPASRTPHAYSALCSGTDFWQHHMLPELDIATAAVLPNKWLACSNDCKLDWARAWVRSHLRDALRLQKPLLLGGVGAVGPQAWRGQLLAMLHQEVAAAVAAGHPIAGVVLSGLPHPDMHDDSDWAMDETAAAAAALQRERPPLAGDIGQAAAWRRWVEQPALLSCLAQQAQGGSSQGSGVGGTEVVLQAVGRLGRLAGCIGGSSSGSGGSGSDSDSMCGGGDNTDEATPGIATA